VHASRRGTPPQATRTPKVASLDHSLIPTASSTYTDGPSQGQGQGQGQGGAVCTSHSLALPSPHPDQPGLSQAR
jgi:hypothetical protein